MERKEFCVEMTKERLEKQLNLLMQHFQRAGVTIPESLAVMDALRGYIQHKLGMQMEGVVAGGLGEHGN